MPITANRHLIRFAAVAVAITVAATGCTSMRRIPNVQAPVPPQGYSHIKPGDEVYVEMADGRRGRFKVQSMDGEAMVAPNGQQYRRAEMHQLKRKQFSYLKTFSLVGAVGLTVIVSYGIAAVSAIDDALSGPN
jgi:hypothetical protein